MFLEEYSWPRRLGVIFPASLVFIDIVFSDDIKAQMVFNFQNNLDFSGKSISTQKYTVEGQSNLGISNSPLGSLPTLSYEEATREIGPDVPLLLEEAQIFETTAESLQGIENELSLDGFWQQSAVDIQAILLELLDLKVATERRDTVSGDLTIDDNSPEPMSEPIINVTTDVAAIPDERVQWRATLWGGSMTDNGLGETLTARNLVFRDSGFLGLGFSRTLAGGNSIKLEGEIQVLQHVGYQDHLEGTAALGLRWEMSPSFSFAIIEGVSYATALPEIEAENNRRESQFLNYLAFEVEYTYQPGWALAGRLHHRSGAGGLYGNAFGGSNAYLFGIRHRF